MSSHNYHLVHRVALSTLCPGPADHYSTFSIADVSGRSDRRALIEDYFTGDELVHTYIFVGTPAQVQSQYTSIYGRMSESYRSYHHHLRGFVIPKTYSFSPFSHE